MFQVSEYNAATPLKSGTPSGSVSYGLNTDDLTDGGGQLVTDETSVVNAVTSGLPAEPETWSDFTGQLWDGVANWALGSNQVKSNSLPSSNSHTRGGPPKGPKAMFEAFEEFYAKLPKEFTHPVALEIVMTSCSMCR